MQMRFISQLQSGDKTEIQIRNTQMLVRSTFVDVKAPGGLTLVNIGYISAWLLTCRIAESARTWKLYLYDPDIKENEGV